VNIPFFEKAHRFHLDTIDHLGFPDKTSMSRVDILSPATPVDFQAPASFPGCPGFRDTPALDRPEDLSLIHGKSDLTVDEGEAEKIFTSLPPLLRGHPDVHLRNGIMNASCKAAENRINAEKAFFVADLGQVYRQHQRWLQCMPDIEPFYGL
jgi:ornithine decarboxylase